jgi:type IX secretion system PorP/SprF family membrane protein
MKSDLKYLQGNLLCLLISVLLGFTQIPTSGQEASVFSNYYLSPFIVNPAFTGSSYYPQAVLSTRKQWVGIPDSPGTILLSGNYRIGTYDFYDPKGFVNKGKLKLKDRLGLGMAIYRDKNGPSENTGGIFSYAYHSQINSKDELSFGMSVIGTYYSFNSSILEPDQPDDPYLLNGNDNKFRLNFNLGALYHSSTYFVGISAAKILPDHYSVNDPVEMQPSYFLMGGYKYKINNVFSIEPSLTVKKLGSEGFSVDVFSKLYVKRINWIALSYSTSGKVNFLFGVHLIKMVYAGYAYEYSLSKISKYTYGTHEIYLGINLGLFAVDGIGRSSGKKL